MADYFPFSKQKLPYDYVALTPYCDPDTLYLHHHALYSSYVDSLNALLASYPAYHSWSLPRLLSGELQMPPADKNRIRHFAGAVYNHELYFQTLCGEPGEEPFGRLGDRIDATYGSAAGFRKLFREAACSLLGPGWVWLVAEPEGALHIVITQNNATPTLDSLRPVFVADTWEHAYCRIYQDRLDRYIEGWFRVLDWVKAEKNYQRILAGAK